MSPLFGDFTEQHWRDVLSVSPEAVPRALIIHGEVGHEHNLARWSEILGPHVQQPQWNILVGEYEDRPKNRSEKTDRGIRKTSLMRSTTASMSRH